LLEEALCQQITAREGPQKGRQAVSGIITLVVSGFDPLLDES